MRARYYDPITGRFISEDPQKDGVNWYSYCGNNPVNLIDSSGGKVDSVLQELGLFLGGYLAMDPAGLIMVAVGTRMENDCLVFAGLAVTAVGVILTLRTLGHIVDRIGNEYIRRMGASSEADTDIFDTTTSLKTAGGWSNAIAGHYIEAEYYLQSAFI